MIKTEYLTIEEAKVQGEQHILKEAELLRAELSELGKSKNNEKTYA